MSNHSTIEISADLQLCTFVISGRRFGVNITDVKEIGGILPITPVPHAKPYILGCMNIRGQVHLIVDIRTFFGFESLAISDTSRFILFKPSVDEPFGIVVDALGDVITINSGDIVERRRRKTADNQPVEDRRAGTELSHGVCMQPAGLLVVLNARGIINVLEQNS